MTGGRDPPTVAPGENVLVVGEGTAPLRQGLSGLVVAGAPPTVVSTDLPARAVLEAYDGTDPPVVVDCSGETTASDATALDATVRVGGTDVPSVGEATVAALDDAPPDGGLCLDAVSTVVARSSVQQAYKLLYLVAERVRAREVCAVYTWNGPVPEKTLRILRRALDDTVRLDPDEAPAVEAADGGR
jgi:hypothetical protein